MKNLEKRGEKYFFRIVLDGRKIREFVGTKPTEARRRAKLIQQRYRQRVEQPGGILTVKEFSERWKLEYIAQERNSKGQDLAERRMDKYILPELGSIFLVDVRTEHLRGLRSRIEASGVSAQTTKHVLSDARCMFRYAVEVGALVASPFRGRLMPRIEEQVPRGFTEEQIRKVIEVAGRYEFPIRLALLTGLRWGEIHRLTWHDIRELPDPHIELERTKNGRVRRVPLSSEAQALIAAERSVSSSIHVYRWRHRQPKQILRFIRGREGIEFLFTFHGLRHTFARRWVESGASLATLQEILGHSTIALTQRYAKMTDEAVFAEARRVLG